MTPFLKSFCAPEILEHPELNNPEPALVIHEIYAEENQEIIKGQYVGVESRIAMLYK
ncbi:hypothetical protein ACI2KR_08600 [Pseudomonas luteola]